eukprot:2378588-Pyramimonas_sp.AAC.1
MAASTASMTLTARPVLAGRRVAAKKAAMPVSRARVVAVKADYIGSAANRKSRATRATTHSPTRLTQPR